MEKTIYKPQQNNVFSRDVKDLRTYKQILLQKNIIIRRKKLQNRSLPNINSSAINSTFTQTDNSFIKTISFDETAGNTSSQSSKFVSASGVQKRKVQKRINWQILKQELHRPKFDHWQGKLVKRMLKTGNFKQMMTIMK